MSDVYRELVEKNYDAYIKTIEKAAALCLYLGIDAASAKGAMIEKTFVEHVLSIS